MTELIKTPKAFLDSDGVVGDFDRHVLELFGTPVNEIPDDEMWDLILATPDFWPTMPLKDGAHDLWNMLRPYKRAFLTGCPKNHYEVAAAHKVTWLKKHFGDDIEVITCLSRDKPLHMEAPGDILIDDMSRNIKRWCNAGGVGVRYRTVEQTMTDFKNVMELLNDPAI